MIVKKRIPANSKEFKYFGYCLGWTTVCFLFCPKGFLVFLDLEECMITLYSNASMLDIAQLLSVLQTSDSRILDEMIVQREKAKISPAQLPHTNPGITRPMGTMIPPGRPPNNFQ